AAGEGADHARNADLARAGIDPDLDELGSEREPHVLALGPARQSAGPLVELLDGVGRHAVRYPFRILLDDAGAGAGEGLGERLARAVGGLDMAVAKDKGPGVPSGERPLVGGDHGVEEG